ncbi:MAG TPA: cytochrome c, partial [Polyangiaceae bacterium]|nr:cytochrome c [Polyangiaceae bacterium]
LKARTEALALVNAVGNLPYTMPGPGRVDAFMTALNLLNPNAKLEMDSPVAFPQLWGVARLKWRHWDNNTTAVLQRNMGQAIGVGALAPEARDQHIIATSLDVQALTTLEGLIQEIQPPRWPFAPPDSHAIAAGKEIYAAQCARCHEPLPDGSMREPSNDPADDPKTDAQRLLNFQQTDPVISRRWPDKSLIQVLALQLASVEKASKVPLELADKDPLWEARGKYGARTLQGVWATAPYLHNNSVLTLADLLKPAATRPKQFVVDYMRYDVNDVGFKDAKSSNIESERFDTAKSGNSNAGHEFGAALSDSDKTNLLAYLKQL